MSKYDFVYMTDSGFAMPTVVSICSLVKNKRKGSVYHIHLIFDNVDEREREFFWRIENKDVKLFLYNVDAEKYDELAKHILTAGIYVSRTDMLKFELPNYLRDLDKVMYIDGDTIINKCIEPIFETDIEGMYLAAADDMGDKVSEDGVSYSGKRIGYPYMRYFNAGIMYLNLLEMRKDDISQKLWDYRENGINYFMSQDALNVVTAEKRAILSCKYNFITSKMDMMTFEEMNTTYFNGMYDEIEECVSDQVILHMAGKMKPWKYNIPWFTDIFMGYYEKSPYAGQKLSLLSPIKEKNDEMMRWIDNILWKVFCQNVKKGEKIVLYGAGNRGRMIYNKNEEEKHCNIVLWVDKNANPNEHIFEPEQVKETTYDKVIISIAKETLVEGVRQKLLAMGVEDRMILVIG